MVVNEAMNRRLPVIASDAVGAAAGGLVRDGRNGLVVPAGDPAALAEAIARLATDPALRARLGEAGAEDVCAFSHDAWAKGFSEALASARPLPGALVALSGSIMRILTPRASTRVLALPVALLSMLLLLAAPAQADIGETIILKCTHGESLSGFSQKDYNKALKELETRQRRVHRLRQSDPPSSAGRRRRPAGPAPEAEGRPLRAPPPPPPQLSAAR